MDTHDTLTFISVDAATRVLYAGPEHPCYGLADAYLRRRLEAPSRTAPSDRRLLVRQVHRQVELVDWWQNQVHAIVAESIARLKDALPPEAQNLPLLR